jgi:hypothetical protein
MGIQQKLEIKAALKVLKPIEEVSKQSLIRKRCLDILFHRAPAE